MLKENNKAISFMSFGKVVDSTFKIKVRPNMTITVFGKPVVVTHAEYQEHNLRELGL